LKSFQALTTALYAFDLQWKAYKDDQNSVAQTAFPDEPQASMTSPRLRAKRFLPLRFGGRVDLGVEQWPPRCFLEVHRSERRIPATFQGLWSPCRFSFLRLSARPRASTFNGSSRLGDSPTGPRRQPSLGQGSNDPRQFPVVGWKFRHSYGSILRTATGSNPSRMRVRISAGIAS